MKNKSTYLTIAIVAPVILVFGLWSWRGTNNEGDSQSVLSINEEVKTYRSEIGEIEFQYPGNVNVAEGRPVKVRSYITNIKFGASNAERAIFSLNVATTTTTDVAQLKFDYRKGIAFDNPAYDDLQFVDPVAPVITVDSSEVITVSGKKALKQVIRSNVNNPSVMTWVHIVNGNKLYSLSMGVPDDSANSKVEKAAIDQYQNLFLSSVKFL